MRETQVDKPENIDDGRVVASMNVDGMPWYTPGKATAAGDTAVDAGAEDKGIIDAPVKMTRRETIAFMSGVIKAALLISLAFIGGLYLFILFCINIWFK